MTRDGGERVFRIFSEAMEHPEEDRDAFLEHACAGDEALRNEVASLVAAEKRSDAFLEPGDLAGALGEALEPGNDPLLGELVGGYRVLEIIARGGMGVVYRAEQTSPRREVALKLIGRGLPTPDLRRRFEIEAQLLGRLQHPGIAQIIEAGVADLGHGGQPFFAMERIVGKPLTEHAEAERLDLRDRVGLVIRICDAVQHAHQKGVIHRDLKPANILVDRTGQPKVLDFGVARSTDPEIQASTALTGQGALVGTLAYMSPEQVRGDVTEIDTRSDVYGLGVVCYELLTGELPHDVHDLPFTEVIRRISDDRAHRLSRPGQAFPPDLETILAKALETDRNRRYSSASELAADLQRFLDDEPIAARPPSTFYHLRKLIARNRIAAGLTVAMVLLLLGFGITMAVQAARIRRERDRAEREARVATRVSEFLSEVFQIPDPGKARGNSVTAREVLDRGAARIREELEDAPDVQARLMVTMGGVYHGLGLMEEGEALLVDALETESRIAVGDPETRLRALADLAWMHRARGAWDEGLDSAKHALDVANESFPGDEPLRMRTLLTLGVLHRDREEFGPASSNLEEALQIGLRVHGEEHEEVARILYHQGWLQYRSGNPETALDNYDAACGIIERTVGDDHPMFAWCLNDRSIVLGGMGRTEESADSLEASIAVWEKILEPDHPNLAMAVDNLGSAYWRAGDYEAAAREYQRGLEMRERRLGPEHADVAGSLQNLALAYRDGGRGTEAIELFRRSQGIYLALSGPDSRQLRNSWVSLAGLHEQRGEVEEALRLYELEAESLERIGAQGSMNEAANLLRRGNCLVWLGRLTEADAALDRSLRVGEEELGVDHPSLASGLLALIRLREEQEDEEALSALIERTLGLLEAGDRTESRYMALTLYRRSRLFRARGETAKADADLERAASILERNSYRNSDAYVRAVRAAHSGDDDAALASLRIALESGFPLVRVDVDPDFVALEGDPRLRSLLDEFPRR